MVATCSIFFIPELSGYGSPGGAVSVVFGLEDGGALGVLKVSRYYKKMT